MNPSDWEYAELWAFANLRGGREYRTSRLLPNGEFEDVWVHGLGIAHQRADRKDGGFLLVEIGADGDVIDDWVEVGFEEAKEHGAIRANAEAEGLAWEPVPDSEDLRSYLRDRLRD